MADPKLKKAVERQLRARGVPFSYQLVDDQGRFPGNDNWGEGWGWALFNARDTEKSASTNFRASCLGCHIPARQTDWIYVQGYPSLRADRDGQVSQDTPALQPLRAVARARKGDPCEDGSIRRTVSSDWSQAPC